VVDQSLAALLLELFRVIHSLAGYPVPLTLPEVHVVPLQQLQARVCGSPCPVQAFYIQNEGVFIEQTLDFQKDPRARAVLLHELVHHVQSLTGRFDSMPVCHAWYAKEREAYAIQNEYLRDLGERVRQYMPAVARRCE
jgi:hypothetical protein